MIKKGENAEFSISQIWDSRIKKKNITITMVILLITRNTYYDKEYKVNTCIKETEQLKIGILASYCHSMNCHSHLKYDILFKVA